MDSSSSEYYLLKKEDLKDILTNNEVFELIILKVQKQDNFNNLFKKRKRTSNNGKNKKLKNNNNNTIDDFLNNLRICTEKCIEILVNNFNINENDIYNEKNIFCPFHEHKSTSKSPSAKFIVKKNYFICFSSNCTTRKANNKTGYSCLNSIVLLNTLKIHAHL